MLRQYGESGWSIREDTYIKIAAGGIGVGFAAGDGVVIEGCREESLNGSHVLEAAEDGALVVPGMIAGQATQTEELTVRRSVPEMDFVIESGNRLWGCRYGVTDGKAVNEIYASKLGDFKNWNCYAGRSTTTMSPPVAPTAPSPGRRTIWAVPVFQGGLRRAGVSQCGGSAPDRDGAVSRRQEGQRTEPSDGGGRAVLPRLRRRICL